MGRRPGPSVRLQLTVSYAAFLVVAGILLLAAVWLFLLRYVPDAIDTPAGLRLLRSDLIRAFAPAASAVLAFLLAFGLAGGWLLAGHMLAPMARITAATRRAATGSLSHRIGLDGRRDEFRELADAFDAMLARLEAQVTEQQRFAANASHELRTPLAMMQTMLEVAAADPDGDTRALAERLRVVNDRAIALTQALLLLARADQRAFDTAPVDLSLLAEEAAETLLPLAERHGVRLDVSGERPVVDGSATLLLQLVTNLVHNAIVYNVPAGGWVRLATSATSSGARLTVENTGEALGPGTVATLTEPFQRGASRVRSDHGGVGLGLAIVTSIVRAHDGVIALDARPGGGLVVSVDLPSDPIRTASTPRPGAPRPPGAGRRGR